MVYLACPASRSECRFYPAISAASRRPFRIPTPYYPQINIHRLPALCFHGLTNSFSRHSYCLTIRIVLRCEGTPPLERLTQFGGFLRNSFGCHTYKPPSCKSFRCHTCEKIGGWAELWLTTTRSFTPRAFLQAFRYRFRYRSTRRLLRLTSLPATISRTHRIAFSCAARLSAVRWNSYGNY
jgi:hypothetical protein